MLSFTEARLAARMGNAIRRRSWPPGDYVTAQDSAQPAPIREGETIFHWQPDLDAMEATDYEVA